MNNLEKFLQIIKIITDPFGYVIDLIIKWWKNVNLFRKNVEEVKDEVDAQPDFKEIKIGSKEFLVECVSCKTIHELSAICISCGKPVCSNKTYCRVIKKDEQLEDDVVYCSICASE